MSSAQYRQGRSASSPQILIISETFGGSTIQGRNGTIESIEGCGSTEHLESDRKGKREVWNDDGGGNFRRSHLDRSVQTPK